MSAFPKSLGSLTAERQVHDFQDANQEWIAGNEAQMIQPRKAIINGQGHKHHKLIHALAE
jgi:hypothetical protein